MRNALVVGDPTTTGGVVLPGTLTTCFLGDSHMATIGGKVSCPACGSTGIIAMSGGPYRETAHGHQLAYEGDIVICKCPVPPKIISMSFPKAQYQDHAETSGAVSLAVAQAHAMDWFLNAGNDPADVGLHASQRFLISDKATGEALANVAYQLECDGKILEGVTGSDGMTQPIYSSSDAPVRVHLRTQA